MNFTSQFTPYSFPLLGLVRLPSVEISAKQKQELGLKPTTSNVNVLKALAWAGYKTMVASGKFTGFTEAEVKDRLKMEFAVFEKTGIVDYLLLVRDILVWCDEQKIARGPGRGSVCGSLSCYFLGITKIDSLKHKLNFTRFLSEARAKPKVVDGITYADGKNLCDIDSDISFVNRARVIQYVEERHKGKTCKISTRLQLTGKTALKDVLKVYLGFNEVHAKSITDSIESQFGKVEDLDKALEKRKELKAWVAEDPKHQRAFDIARALEGLNMSKGQHPSGVFISYAPLDGNIPIELAKTKETVTSNDMNVAATLGVKIDLLGLRSVDLIEEASLQAGIKSEDIDVNDPVLYQYLSDSDLYYGLFQVEDGLTKQVVRKVGPKTIEHLAACLALSRPGSLRYIDDFVKFMKEGTYKEIYPAIDALLKATGNILLYQEQINDVCQQVYKLSAVDADEVRRAIGKKIKEDMAKWEPILYANGLKHGIPETVTKYFWDVCNASADYLFSVNHSTGYSYITAQTAYLKAKYPREFVFALLKLSRHEPDSQGVLQSIIVESKQMGITILPPDITKSQEDFSLEPNGVRFGLSHIRGISDTTMAKLASFRREFRNKFDVFDAAQEAKINISTLVGLIYSGTLNVDNTPRPKLAVEAQVWNILTEREKPIVAMFAPDFNNDLVELLKGIQSKVDEKGKPYIKPSRMETIRKELKPYWKMYQDNTRYEELCIYIMERHYLGFSYSNTLHNLYSKQVDDLMPVSKVLAEPKGNAVSFVAFVGEVKEGIGRASKKAYLRFDLTDETAKAKAMLNGTLKIEGCRQFNGELPKEGDIVIVHGTRADSEDMVFANSIIVQPNPIKLKKSGDIEA